MTRLLQLLFRAWRASLGRLLPDSCRFTPSCSVYAQQAVGRHGPLRGSLKALWRIARCHPFSRGGYDPVVPSAPPCRSAARGADATEISAGGGA